MILRHREAKIPHPPAASAGDLAPHSRGEVLSSAFSGRDPSVLLCGQVLSNTSPRECGARSPRALTRRVRGLRDTAQTTKHANTRLLARRAPRRALSLIEVILALAILVLSLAAITQLVGIGTDRGNDARAYARGARLAQAKMAEVEAGLVPLTGEAEGQFDGDDAAWSYKIFVADAGPPNLYTVTVNVIRDVNGRQVVVSLAQMMFDPTKVGSTAQAERPGATDDTTSGTGTGTGGTSP